MASLTFDSEDIILFRNEINAAEEIAIISHTNPDGDCVGSLLAMREVLISHLGKKSSNIAAVLPNACPDNFKYLKGSDLIIDAEEQFHEAEAALLKADLILCLDFNRTSRVATLQNALESSTAFRLLIDHHEQPDRDAFQLIFSEPALSSTCELLYWLLDAAYVVDVLNDSSAQCLYNGICTDTGTFSYSNENASLYEASAGLMHYNVHAAEVHNQIANSLSVDSFRFRAHCMNDCIHILEGEGIAYFVLTLEDRKHYGVKPSDMEGLVNETLTMKNIEVGLLFREEKDDIVRVSLRSKHHFDVNAFARQHLGGGGHVKAAGATMHGKFPETIEHVVTLLRLELKSSF